MTFYIWWASYPRRKGSNPRTLAEQKYQKALQNGADPEHLLTSIKKYGDELREQNLIDTPYVCMASTWLHQKRYLDYAPDPGSKERNLKIDQDMLRRGYVWKEERWQPLPKNNSPQPATSEIPEPIGS